MEEEQKIKAVRHTTFIEVHQGEMVALTRRLGAIGGFRTVQWRTSNFTLEASQSFMLNSRDEPRYCGCTISVFLGTVFPGTSVRYDPVFHTVFLEADESKGDVSLRNRSSARADCDWQLTELGRQVLDMITRGKHNREKRGTKRLRFTSAGLQTDLVSFEERKAAVDKLVDQWSRLDALDPDKTRHVGSSGLALRFHSIYTQMEDSTSSQELAQLVLDQDKLKGELDQLATELLRDDSAVFQPVAEEVSRMSVSTVDTRETSPTDLGDQFPSFETLY